MILQGKQNLEKQVSNTQIVEFKDYVKNTGLLNKKCKEINDAAMDYFAVYHLKLFNQKKVIYYPSCASDIHSLDQIICAPNELGG
jgi:ABC-type enterochelin transport system ATPase subunit